MCNKIVIKSVSYSFSSSFCLSIGFACDRMLCVVSAVPDLYLGADSLPEAHGSDGSPQARAGPRVRTDEGLPAAGRESTGGSGESSPPEGPLFGGTGLRKL